LKKIFLKKAIIIIKQNIKVFKLRERGKKKLNNNAIKDIIIKPNTISSQTQVLFFFKDIFRLPLTNVKKYVMTKQERNTLIIFYFFLEKSRLKNIKQDL
tara:strand:+ start:100 stop:396 length:297 start_codon:yes stop_codon:yes gene_type:complete